MLTHLIVVRRDIDMLLARNGFTQTQELPKTRKIFNVSTDIEEFGRFKAKIVRILQISLDEPSKVCYITSATIFCEILCKRLI